jgi:hypothetical protein
VGETWEDLSKSLRPITDNGKDLDMVNIMKMLSEMLDKDKMFYQDHILKAIENERLLSELE